MATPAADVDVGGKSNVTIADAAIHNKEREPLLRPDGQPEHIPHSRILEQRDGSAARRRRGGRDRRRRRRCRTREGDVVELEDIPLSGLRANRCRHPRVAY